MKGHTSHVKGHRIVRSVCGMLLQNTTFIASFKYTISIYKSYSGKAIFSFIDAAMTVSDSVSI